MPPETPKWRRPKPPKPKADPDLKVVVTEENLAQYAYNFPRNQSLSPFDKFWQEHRHEEKDPAKREKMDKAMEKYV